MGKEYSPNGFWWDQMWQAGNPVSPGFVPEEPLVAEGPLPIATPHDTEVKAMILCMRHRCRASECGCTIGNGT